MVAEGQVVARTQMRAIDVENELFPWAIEVARRVGKSSPRVIAALDCRAMVIGILARKGENLGSSRAEG